METAYSVLTLSSIVFDGHLITQRGPKRDVPGTRPEHDFQCGSPYYYDYDDFFISSTRSWIVHVIVT